MELYELVNPIERILAAKADVQRTPLGGTMELLPLCNMNCKMCYIRQTKEEMDTQGRMLSCDEWLSIAQDAKANGVLYLLMTGGEPLLYPEFKRLYTELTNMGFIITINTNGTLIDEKWADFFGKRPCRRLNITLYGKDDETYEKLCGNPHGFSQVMKAVEFLQERKVPFRFNCSVTPDNVEQIPQMYQIAKSRGIYMETSGYMFPPVRKKFSECTEFARMSPQQAADFQFTNYQMRNPMGNIKEAALKTLEKVKPREAAQDIYGLTCRAGRSGFWMNWKGELLPCGMFMQPKISLLEHSFAECWAYIVEETGKICRCQECEKCEKHDICKVCTAACLTETGKSDGKPEYLCKMTDAFYERLQEYLDKEER